MCVRLDWTGGYVAIVVSQPKAFATFLVVKGQATLDVPWRRAIKHDLLSPDALRDQYRLFDHVVNDELIPDYLIVDLEHPKDGVVFRVGLFSADI